MAPEIKILRESFLFSQTDDSEFEEIMRNITPTIKSYSRGETIYSPSNFEKKLGFVICGECDVIRKNESGALVRLKSTHATEPFGIMSVFGDIGEYPTTIVAKKNSTVCFLDKSDIDRLIDSYPSVSRGIIDFFAGRIKFLNMKIATFSSISVEQKLAHHILELSKVNSSDKFDINKARTATEIGVGRASLYRTLEDFETQNIIEIKNKTLRILSFEALERILK